MTRARLSLDADRDVVGGFDRVENLGKGDSGQDAGTSTIWPVSVLMLSIRLLLLW